MGEEPARELDDPARGGAAVVVPRQHAAGPEDVVGDEEAARPQVLVREVYRLRIAVLVDVVVDDVPAPAHAAERGRRLFTVVRDPRPDAGLGQEPLGEPDVLRGK